MSGPVNSATGDGLVDANRLNDRVTKIVEREMAKAKRDNKPLPIDIEYSLKPKSVLWAGLPIYENRFEPLTYFWAVMGLSTVTYFVVERGFLHLALYTVFMLLVYDFYSGMLHIVLDNPRNISLPLLGQPALEFQWHHYIPNDITSKSLAQACGDLNGAVIASAICYLLLAPCFEDKPSYAGVVGLKVLMAYFGQFSHRSAHDYRPTSGVKTLQNSGLIISAADHKIHHTAPHDLDFCLIGICNPLFDRMNKWFKNEEFARWFWLTAFIAWTLLDVPLAHWGLSTLVAR